MTTKYGCINEDSIQVTSPRMIDSDEYDTIQDAMNEALYMLETDTEKVSIVKVKYYGDDNNGYWGEIVGEGCITIDACNANEWFDPDLIQVDELEVGDTFVLPEDEEQFHDLKGVGRQRTVRYIEKLENKQLRVVTTSMGYSYTFHRDRMVRKV